MFGNSRKMAVMTPISLQLSRFKIICSLAYVGGDKYKKRSSYITTDITPLNKDFNRVGSLKSVTQKSVSSPDGDESNLRRNSYENSSARENGNSAGNSKSSTYSNDGGTDSFVGSSKSEPLPLEHHHRRESTEQTIIHSTATTSVNYPDKNRSSVPEETTIDSTAITPTIYAEQRQSSVPEIMPVSEFDGRTHLTGVETREEEPAQIFSAADEEVVVSSESPMTVRECAPDSGNYSYKQELEHEGRSVAASSLIAEESVEVSEITTISTSVSPQKVLHGPAAILDEPIKPSLFIEKPRPLPQDVEHAHLPPLPPEPALNEQEYTLPDEALDKDASLVNASSVGCEEPAESTKPSIPRDESPPRRTSSGRPAFEAASEASRAELIKSFGYSIGEDGEAVNKSSKKLFMM